MNIDWSSFTSNGVHRLRGKGKFENGFIMSVQKRKGVVIFRIKHSLQTGSDLA